MSTYAPATVSVSDCIIVSYTLYISILFFFLAMLKEGNVGAFDIVTVDTDSSLQVTSTIFRNNIALGDGGAAGIYGDATFIGCMFDRNSALAVLLKSCIIFKLLYYF